MGIRRVIGGGMGRHGPRLTRPNEDVECLSS
jgi:hypothetical protein